MKKTMSINRMNRLLRLGIILLVLLLAGYGVKCLVETSRMKAELAEMQNRVKTQEQENREVGNLLENSEYYLEQQARGENDYSDPEEKVFVVVP